jgi:hypothetical protein
MFSVLQIDVSCIKIEQSAFLLPSLARLFDVLKTQSAALLLFSVMAGLLLLDKPEHHPLSRQRCRKSRSPSQ